MGAPARRTVDDLLAEARASLERLEPDAASRALHEGALLVDVRSEVQRERDGVVPGAVYFHRNVIEWRADPSSDAHDPAFADPNRTIVVMCHEGYQSSLVAATLQQLGFPAATDLAGGFVGWRDAGLPVADGNPPQP